MRLIKKFFILFLVISFVLAPIDFDNIFSQTQDVQAFEEITEDTI
ncbi:hypothetical protein BMS3Abin15_00674 [bacterium BMS3Abin15]|nr:hypothetical protein BMS3Abin15_00674 [bacterium BMS3Abin15]